MAVLEANKVQDVKTKLTYLARNELYQREKPYATDFLVEHIDGAEATNHLFELMDVVVNDARGSEHCFYLNKQGFCFRKFEMVAPGRLANEDGDAVKEYYEQLEICIEKSFPEYRRVEVIDHLVSDSSNCFARIPTFTDGIDRCGNDTQAILQWLGWKSRMLNPLLYLTVILARKVLS